MAKRVSVAEHQAMQRGESEAIVDDSAEALRRIGAPLNGQADAVGEVVGETPDGRVWVTRETEADQRDEFAAQVAGHTYSVEQDGTVRDWRRPDTTPDRGDVTVEHTVTDDEPRFSGGGADQADDANRYSVPSDAEFRGKLYRDAPDLANIAENLIHEHGFLSDLMNAEIRYYWRRKTGVSKGRVKIGYCKRASDLLGHFSGADFLIWLSATTARDGKFTPKQVEAAIFHQLLHIETDDEGNFISARHDFEGFAAEIRHYGTWTEDLKLVVPAVDAARQMGLFDVDDGIEDDDEDDFAQATGQVDGSVSSTSNEGQEEDILADLPVI